MIRNDINKVEFFLQERFSIDKSENDLSEFNNLSIIKKPKVYIWY